MSISDQPTFTMEPYQPSKLEPIKKILHTHKKSLIIGVVSTLIISSATLAFIFINPRLKATFINKLNLSQAASESAEKKDIFSSLLYRFEKSSPQPSPSTTSSPFIPSPASNPSSSLSPSPSPSPKSSPSPSPSPPPNPPQITISYPYENQAISMDNSQTLCIVDIPSGGNTSGVQRKYKLNNQSWTGYTNNSTLCIDPQEGNNIIYLQYKNSLGEESTIYTRNFSFHKIYNITINISGRIYLDNNCNASVDAQENFLNMSGITVNIWEMPNYRLLGTQSTNSEGFYVYSSTIPNNQSLTIGATAVSPSTYKSPPSFSPGNFTLTASSPTAVQNIPQVPAANISQCQ